MEFRRGKSASGSIPSAWGGLALEGSIYDFDRHCDISGIPFHAALDLAANPGGSPNPGDLFPGCSRLRVRDQTEADFQTLERLRVCNGSWLLS